jgi:hypothetical protein
LRANPDAMFIVTVMENSARRFTSRLGRRYVIGGDSSFQFDDSLTVHGGTIFTRNEKLTGGLAAMWLLFRRVDKRAISPFLGEFNAE